MSAIHDPNTLKTQSNIARMLGRVRAEIVDALDTELAPFDITAAQFVILDLLIGAGVDSASALCKEISYDPGAMTRMIDRLELKRLIRRLPRSDDRRKVDLELTAEGKAVYPKLRASAIAVQNRFLRGFTGTEVRQLEECLQRMLANA